MTLENIHSQEGMRVAFLVGNFPNLSETFILNQITGLIDRGHDVSVYGRRPSEIPAKHNEICEYGLLERVEYIPSLPKSKLDRIRKALWLLGTVKSTVEALNLLRSLQLWKYGRVASNLQLWYAASVFGEERSTYDVVHAHFGPNGALAVALRNLGLIEGKIITTFHGADMTRYLERVGLSGYDFLARQGDLFLPISERWKKKLIELGFPEDRTFVHHMGVSCKELDFNPPVVEDETIQILSVSRLTEKKGLQYGIRALSQCLDKMDINIKYTIVGDGEQREPLELLVDDLGVRKHVCFTGWKSKSEVVDLLKQAHIFLAPSVTAESGDQEGIPVAIMEAMARGLPVVSTWHSGIPELVADGASGLLVPERDVEALVGALQSLLKHPNRLTELGRAGRSIVEDEFDIEILNDELVHHYVDVMN